MSSQGSLAVPGELKTSPGKILKIDESFIGITGSSAHQLVLGSVAANHSDVFDFASAATIFESFRRIHDILKDDYFLMTREDDEEQEYESNQLFGIICSRSGIYGIQSYREVTEFNRYWASGSGAEIALGSLYASYDTDRTALEIAVLAVEATCQFDKSCGPPIERFDLAIAG